MRKLLTLLLVTLAFANASAKHRVATEVNYMPDASGFVLYDSIRYTYSGDRHSNYTFRTAPNHADLWYIPSGELVNNICPNFLALDASDTYDSTYAGSIPEFDTAKYWLWDASASP